MNFAKPLCVLAAFAFPTFSSAGEIALTFESHGVTISGEFAGFQDDAYILITTAGPLHVPANLATCEGEDCLVQFTANNE
ncbi:hypothetical protein [Loktanella sp. S4079]|uniref:hypothetical protein n=1 Tax=Loktanella sp. S4079 TaxID=579483 RepID=UPI0005FA66E3|nr:hypothetical protein [Loktanella sp. S4079]KJZ19884.1 hypothetical protein TW80_03135 [Loktanella sp. S4079]